MSRLANWFLSQQRRNARFVSIQDLFFGQKAFSYIIYRLKIFNLQVLFRYIFFCFFFLAIYGSLAAKTFNIVAVLILSRAAISAFWWGGLEVMRSQIRHDYFAHDEKNLDKTLGIYLYFAGTVFVLAFSAILFLWYHFIFVGDLPQVMQWFLLVYSSKIALDILIRTYHSGAYAITRIIRTPFSIIAPDVMGLLTLAIFYPLYPEYAALISLITRSFISMALLIKFVTRMYRFYELEPVFPKLLQFIKWLEQFPIREYVLAATSFLLIQGDIILVALATYLMETSYISNELFAVLFLISPMFSATTDWAFLFYFDRKRMRSRDFSKFMAFYNEVVGRSAVIFSLIYWLIALFAVAILISKEACWYLVILLPVFIIKAKMADLQIKRFSYNGYIDVIFSSFFIILALVFAYRNPDHSLINYLLILISFVAVIKTLQKKRFKPIQDSKLYKLPVSLYNFLYRLTKHANRQLTIYYITAADNIHTHQQFYILDNLSMKFVQKNEEICIIDDTHYLFYTTNRELTRYEILEACSGLVHSVEKRTILCPKHLEYLLHNRHDIFSHFLPKTFLRTHTKQHHEKIYSEFLQIFPKGIAFSPEPQLGQEAKTMPLNDTRSMYIKTIQYLFHTRNQSYSDYDVTVCYSKGRIEYVFAVPFRAYPVATIKRWQHFIHDQNIIHATLDDAITTGIFEHEQKH